MKTNNFTIKLILTFSLIIYFSIIGMSQNGIELGPSSATGDHAIAGGDGSSAVGDASLAIGTNAQANGDNSVGFGESTNAIGNRSFAFGFATNATGIGSVAGGQASSANGENSMAIGLNNTTNSGAYGSLALGIGNTTTGANSVALGESNQAIGGRSVAMGMQNVAHAFGEVALGQFCEEYEGYTASLSNVATDRLFVLGNGASSSDRSNAVTVLKGGNSGFGISYPSQNVHVKSGVRVESSTNTPNPKTVYANSMPIAYGSFLPSGAIVSDYGITSAAKSSAGIYIITLDNGWVGVPAVNATVRFGGIVGEGITITHEFDEPTKRIFMYFADADTGLGGDQAFSLVVYGQPKSGAGSGCSPVQSPTGILQAPNEEGAYYVTEDPDCGCITEIPFAFTGPNPNVLITVGGFVGSGTGTVMIDLEVTSPNGGGSSFVSTNLTSSGASVNVGVFTGEYGAVYDTYIDLTYDGTQFIEATVRMVAL